MGMHLSLIRDRLDATLFTAADGYGGYGGPDVGLWYMLPLRLLPSQCHARRSSAIYLDRSAEGRASPEASTALRISSVSSFTWKRAVSCKNQGVIRTLSVPRTTEPGDNLNSSPRRLKWRLSGKDM